MTVNINNIVVMDFFSGSMNLSNFNEAVTMGVGCWQKDFGVFQKS